MEGSGRSGGQRVLRPRPALTQSFFACEPYNGSSAAPLASSRAARLSPPGLRCPDVDLRLAEAAILGSEVGPILAGDHGALKIVQGIQISLVDRVIEHVRTTGTSVANLAPFAVVFIDRSANKGGSGLRPSRTMDRIGRSTLTSPSRPSGARLSATDIGVTRRQPGRSFRNAPPQVIRGPLCRSPGQSPGSRESAHPQENPP